MLGHDNRFSLRIIVIIIFIPSIYEMVVAIAAPWMPMAFKGPQPKINIGSRTALVREVIIMIQLGLMLSPFALKTEFPMTKQAKNGEPIYHIDIYSLISISVSPFAPRREKI